MNRPAAVLGSALFLVIAPGTVGVYVPWMFCRWQFEPPFFGLVAIRILGLLFLLVGLPVLLDSFARFALQGLGTPAPIAPPQRLVITGFYRYVRNPMYVAVVSLVIGQGLLFGSLPVLEYAVVLWLGFTAFVLAYEEPVLRVKFGQDYLDYCRQVRRWLPRLRPHAP